MRFELRFQVRAQRAALNARRARGLIDLEHAIQMHQIDRHRAAIVAATWRLDAADDAGATAVRRRGNLRAIAPFQNADDVLLIARERDHVDRIRIVTAKRADEITRALAVAVPGAIVRAGRANFLE